MDYTSSGLENPLLFLVCGLLLDRYFAVMAAAPLVVWSLFAVFYYGSPWPNPALAKLTLGLDRGILVSQGFTYLSTARHDPVLALVIVAGTVAAVVIARMVATRGRVWAWSLAGLAILSAMALPLTPLNSPRTLTDSTVNQRLVDERAFYFQSTSLRVRLRTPADAFPVHPWADDGRNTVRRDQTVMGAYNVGFFGYLAGLDKIIVDRYAITDPLLARIPPKQVADDWRPGHIKRAMPAGYGRSLQYGTNDVRDGRLHELYEDVRLATSAPLLERGRAGAIWRLNVSSGRER